MEGVKIIDLELVKNNEKGSTFQFENRKEAAKVLLIKRKKGTISGAHYHTGKNPMKDPETFMIIDGEAEVILKHLKTKEEFKEIYKKPIMFKLAPYVYHEIRALTDIILVDMNSIEDDDDTVRGFL
tara:strand:- start:1300 stop:1677 length:378 start_codon:yes stop_codon:yes gene_type:complete